MAENRVLSIGDIFNDLRTLVEAHEIMTSDIRVDGIKRVKRLQEDAVKRVAEAVPLRETRTIGDVFRPARVLI